MTNSNDIEIATFEAKCGSCGEVFDLPSLGEFAYGQFIFSSANGKFFAYCFLPNPTAKLIQVVLPENCSAEMYQSALAELADPIFGQKLKNVTICPKCNSANLAEFRSDTKTGSMWVKPATYEGLLSLSRNELINTVTQFAKNYRA